MLADAYGGYGGIAIEKFLVLAGCWAMPGGSWWTAAIVQVEGPAVFGLDSTMRGFLEYGRVSVYAPEEARDFVVGTATMEIVDLGTRFTMSVMEGTAQREIFDRGAEWASIKPALEEHEMRNANGKTPTCRNRACASRTSPSAVSRRRFLKAALASPLAAPLVIPCTALGRDGTVAPSERIVLGGIGLGPRGQYDLSVMLPEKDVQFVAVADVQKVRREQVKQMVDARYGNRDCVTYSDMFEVLARRDIDAVLIATGDHWHALASILAAKAGKDVYSEKPCGMTIGEVQALAGAVNRYGRVFQAGTQRRSVGNFQYAAHLAKSGKLGRLHTLHASVYVPEKNYAWLPAEPDPPREQCDWDRWLGPAPWRPYNRRYAAGGWRGHHDFEAGGNFLDWGAHTVDLCQWANQSDDTMPVEYEATPTSVIGTYANGVKLVCDFLPTAFGNREPQYHTSTGTCPVIYKGTEGWVETGDNGQIILSDSLAKLRNRQFADTGLSSAGHGRNFFDCVKSRALPVCNQHIMRRSHIACFAAQLSWQLGRKLRIDPVTETFINDDEANRMRARATREPWSLYI